MCPDATAPAGFRPCTAAELARHLGGTLEGDGTVVVRTVETLADAGPDTLSWVGRAGLERAAAASRAGILLVGPDFPTTSGRTVIRVGDPDLAVCAALRRLGPAETPTAPGVHPSAVVAPDASVDGVAVGPLVSIGARTRVGAGTRLHAGVRLDAEVTVGRDCVLWPNVVVRERVRIGDRVVIHPNSTIGADGFGYLQRGGRHVKIPQIGTVIIEDDVEVGANTCIDRARSGVTRVGRGTKIDNLVQVGHNVVIGEDCIIISQCGISGSTTLGHHVVLAGQVGLIDHLHIGDQVQVAAKSAIFEDVPAGKAYRGIPATEHVAFGRQQISLRKLPRLIEELRALTRRMERLESAVHDSPGG